MKRLTCATLFFLLITVKINAQSSAPIVVKAGQLTAPVQPTMYGIFFEDINFGADGGIYAELVKNRSFEFYKPLMGWKVQQPKGDNSAIQILNRAGQDANPRYARFLIRADKDFGIVNEGFRGMGIKKDNQYDFSVLARVNEGSNNSLRIELTDSSGRSIGKAVLPISGGEWKKYSVSFTATATNPKAELAIWFEGAGVIDMDMISLFPKDTWKNRPGGLRADLVQLLADLKPGFLRFPGGCIVEGHELETRYQWKKTIGNIEDRELIVNRWNTEFRHRLTPDYFQSFGLGFFEYFQLAEDIGAEPLPILNCGMACQFNTSELVPLDQLDPYIQDALDLIEFANGPVTSKWGKLRADFGHPEPFNMKLLGVGNEQWGEQYVERYKAFEKVLKEKYPDVRLVGAVGPFSDGPLFDYLNPQMRATKVDLIDEHYYKPPEWFLQNAARYDNYDRNGPKIFAGEYAAHGKDRGNPQLKSTWYCALSEAAFITGLERNADVVHMTSYAPLFAHVDAWQWAPDLIWFNNLRSYGTANYYVQKLFSLNKGTHIVPIQADGKALTGQQGLYASASVDKNTNELILKIVNTATEAQVKQISVEGVKRLGKKAKLIVLSSDDPDNVNSLDNPKAISPSESELTVKGKKISITAGPQSVTVVRVNCQW